MAILRLSDPNHLPGHLRNAVVAIGNFDGVHRGHQAVLEKALEAAGASGRASLVLTFEPHPRSVFVPDQPVDRLTPAAEKAEILGALGFDAVVECPFTREFSQLTADDFVDRILVEALGASRIVAGFDFHFGRGRQGGPAFLMDAGQGRGFDVTLVDAFRDEGGQAVSSSRIRSLFGEGEVVEAAGLLGYRHRVRAPVIQGKQLGRTLGFPTANMALPPETHLKHGIYAVRFRRADGSLHDGVASFGRRPTVDAEGEPLLETYVFDFSGNLYGEVCAVSFFAYLRGEEKFDGLEPLMQQIRRDEEEARALLQGVRPLSPLDAALNFA
ncbi:bifunctional riboflavin kinase/FAD synthetase [Phyllobacterium sp. 21LDTY02-6]|uniref:bifunctional riboflavin kinase/FAD synthetase n=1 Tax=unclassified Phyllobacterium TaxID=2638441 RepID=UPI0020208133|nr:MULTISPECIES: bifunctional riboflavin kinase/FAD synthetase [unclassified Phyllobacterium]MCO4318670.1 bifunctional riboflavin kinase/FAD synthetase [Phyllobacterium sp. 21LDTY02-6]MCX8281185.1 bifunctional riboflavin kinase/FAD synthetase [Phyllobacterium sp. 0TCS1.6C]MCX8294528.1 bifunctional riboflavin kinase/FAD synthetase [Phyllobacterium sp. 0TCS1.6A]